MTGNSVATNNKYRYLDRLLNTEQGTNLFNVRIVALLCASLIFTPLVGASQRIVLNTAYIQVDDQSQRTQQNALKKALKQVVIKLSGNSDVISNAGIQDALSLPQAFLRSYRFEYEDTTTYYVAEFDQAKLSRLLQQEMLPLWGAIRPETLVWIAQEQEDESRIIIDESSVSSLKDELQDAARERGVPVSFPIMDLTDSASIASFDVWGRFVEPLEVASSRYATDNIIGARIYKNDASAIPALPENSLPSALIPTLEDVLVNDKAIDKATEDTVRDSNIPFGERLNERRGALTGSGIEEAQELKSQNEQNEGNVIKTAKAAFTMDEFKAHAKRAQAGDYALDWVFIFDGNVKHGSIYGDSPEGLGSQLIDIYANHLSSLYAIVGTEAANREVITISVANVGSINSYASANRYLNNLSVVESATLIQQQGIVATYSVTLLGTVDDFMNSLRLESAMKPVTDAYGQTVETLSFYWSQ